MRHGLLYHLLYLTEDRLVLTSDHQIGGVPEDHFGPVVVSVTGGWLGRALFRGVDRRLPPVLNGVVVREDVLDVWRILRFVLAAHIVYLELKVLQIKLVLHADVFVSLKLFVSHLLSQVVLMETNSMSQSTGFAAKLTLFNSQCLKPSLDALEPLVVRFTLLPDTLNLGLELLL